ncbi:MAG: hypothetical protein EP332_07700 [Bacteroidetes bacterium]|nr:MAG: hypothetical protein EP332_07700 [Bacteroidota bacterium]
MTKTLNLFLALSVFALSACDGIVEDSRGEKGILKEQKEKEAAEEASGRGSKEKYTGVKVSKYKSGQKKAEVAYKDGVRHGSAISYYEDGAVCMKEEYVDGKREGKYYWYNTNGKLYKEIDYINGNKNGWEMVFYGSGKLKYKQEYYKGEPTGKLEEFRSDGTPIALPDMEITAKGKDGRGNYIYEVKFSQKMNGSYFYVGTMEGEKFNTRWRCQRTTTGGHCEIEVPSGKAFNGVLTFKGEGKTAMKNEFVVYKDLKVNLH